MSDWQVLVPTPPSGPADGFRSEPVEVTGTPVRIGAHYYVGVTAYPRLDFPGWLVDGVEHIEQTELAYGDNAYPVGSTDTGILVDDGPAYLGCAEFDEGPCDPVLLTRDPDGWHHWGTSSDGFPQPGADMEVYVEGDYSTGESGQLVFAGRPGTDVARVDLVTTDGRTVPGHVATDSIVPGASMIWGTVVGEVAAVVAYDADGEVIEDHEVR